MSSTDVRDDQLPRGAGGAAEVKAVPAASILLLRGEPFEVLMIRRVESSSFVPSAWVFPGGMVDQTDREIASELSDGSERAAMEIAAIRELFEETGVWLGEPLEEPEQKRRRLLAGSLTLRHLVGNTVPAADLVWTARWITPVGIPKRFDTWFFLATAPEGCEPSAHEDEAADLTWITPREALDRHAAGEFPMVFPTLKNLEAIASFDTTNALLDARRDARIETTLPRLVVDGDKKRIVID